MACCIRYQGNKTSDWTPSNNDVQKQIADAVAKADAAKAQADNAKIEADKAKAEADKANQKIADISNDDLLTVSEKPDVLKEWQQIQGEKSYVEQQAATYGISSAPYTAAFTALQTYLTPLLANMAVDTAIVGATFRLNFKNYYDAKIALLKLVTDAAKGLADQAKSAADAAKATAEAAKLAADQAKATADAAQAKADQAKIDAESALNKIGIIVNDGILDTSEKPAILKEIRQIDIEKPIISSQADVYGIDNSSYLAWYNNLISDVAPLLTDMSVNSPIDRNAFINSFTKYYEQREYLLKLISERAKLLANNAQDSANNAQTAANAAKAQADAAKAQADAAKAMIDIVVNDGILDRSEKPAVRKELAQIKAEYPHIINNASYYAIDYGTYVAATNQVINYVEPILAKSPTTPPPRAIINDFLLKLTFLQ